MNARSPLLVVLASTAVFAADPAHVIIFGGGVTEAEGAAALASFKKLEPLIAKVVTLPAGEPKVVDSSTLPGLKPGFQVVTLGVCKSPAPALAALKALYPGTYSKPLTGDVAAERCPAVTALTAAAIEPSVKVGTSVLNAFTLSESSADERGRDTSSSTVGFVLVEKSTGRVRGVETATADSAGRSGEGPSGWEYEVCAAKVTAEKSGFLVTRTCSDERTGCYKGERELPSKWTETLRVTVKRDALVVGSSKKAVTADTSCGSGSDEGD